MKKSRIFAFLLAAVLALSVLVGCGKTGGTDGQKESGADKNTIPWNGVFNGTELPAPAGRSTVSEYTVKDDSVTIRITGMSWEEYKAYCAVLEALDGWEKNEDECVARFPDDYNARQKTYCTGAYKNLPHISVQYYSDEYAAQHELPNFVMFVFTEW